MPNEKRRMERNVQRMEDELNMMKEAVWAGLGLKVRTVVEESEKDRRQGEEICELEKDRIRGWGHGVTVMK